MVKIIYGVRTLQEALDALEEIRRWVRDDIPPETCGFEAQRALEELAESTKWLRLLHRNHDLGSIGDAVRREFAAEDLPRL